MTTWTETSTSSTSWTNVSDVSQGYFETEDNIYLLTDEDGVIFQQEDNKAIAPDDWQDIPAVATTTWTVQ